MAVWDTSCRDWERRIIAGESIIPALPFDHKCAAKALRIFKRLRIKDVRGYPTMGEACPQWVFDFVYAVFGSRDAETKKQVVRSFLLMISKKNGKALALDTEVATPLGFTKIGDLCVGDLVIGEDGLPTRVAWKGPVFTDHACYEVIFSTGERVIADAGHLWVTDAHTDRDRQRGRNRDERKRLCPSVKTTEEIADSLKVKSGKYEINNHRTSLPKQLGGQERTDLEIAPYVLGAWLGDGTSSKPEITAGAADADEMQAIIASAGQRSEIVFYPCSRTAATIKFRDAGEGGAGNGLLRFTAALRHLNLLNNKHIPRSYLRASPQQRLALLQGLMDTDGTISKAGQASYSTTSARLRDDVVELIASLGLKPSICESRAVVNGKDCGACWGIQFWPFNNIKVFQLKRKLQRQRASRAANSARSTTRQIVSVNRVQPVPVQCIAVENESKQFLVTRSFIPTHNSTIAAGVMMTALIMNDRAAGEFTILAPTKEIANNSFLPAMGMVELDHHLGDLFKANRNYRTIEHKVLASSLRVVAADAETVGGGKSIATLIDELWLFGKSANFANILSEVEGALIARPEGFIAFLSTQSDEEPAGEFKRILNHMRDVRDGVIKDPTSLPVIFEFPKALREDEGWRSDEALWRIPNPSLGYSADIDFLRNGLVNKVGTKEARNLFFAKHFNIEIGQGLRADRWSGAEFFQANVDKSLKSLDALLARCDVVVVGIDGGGLDDLLGLAVLGRDKNTREWLLWVHAWAHRIVLERRKDVASKLLDFERDGDLTIVEMPGEDVEEVSDIIMKIERLGLLPEKAAIGVDAVGIGDIVDAITGPERRFALDRIIGISQGWKLNGAIKTTERKLAGGELLHGGMPMMAWAVGNAKAEARGNAISITKQAAGSAKIDPLMATFDAVSLMAANPEAKGRSYLQSAPTMLMLA